jgi:hypothetical protein
MSETSTDDSATVPLLSPLLRRDPPAVDNIRLLGRLAGHDAGMTYAGRVEPGHTTLSPLDPAALPQQPIEASADEQVESPADEQTTPSADEQIDDERRVAVVMLTAGAESDSYARARFRNAIADLDRDCPDAIVAEEDEEDLAPWVAVAVVSWDDGLAVGRRLLGAVTLEEQAPLGAVHGPEFRPHWWERVTVGRWRLWPLPWPSRLSSAGRWTFLAAFAVICAIAAIALWIAIQVFRNQPPPAPAPGPGPGPNPPPSPSPTSPSPTDRPGPLPTQGGPTGRTIPPIV